MNVSNQDFNNSEQTSTLVDIIEFIKEWFGYLKKYTFILILSGLLGGVVGYLYAYFKKPAYVASYSFAMEDEKASGTTGLSGALGLASSLGIDLGTSAGGAFSGANLMELMKSRKMVEKALLNPISINGKVNSLANVYLDFSGIRDALSVDIKNISYPVDGDRTKFTLQQDSVLGLMYAQIAGINGDGGLFSVSQRDKKISIINIEVKTTNELFSKVFVESIAKEVSSFYVETKSRKARMNVAILQKQADSIRNELNMAISGVAQASDETYNLNPALNIKKTPGSRRQVDVQANTAILTQLVTNLEMAKVTLLKETPLIQPIDKPILPLKKEKLGKLKTLLIVGFSTGFFVLLLLIGIRLYKKYVQHLFFK